MSDFRSTARCGGICLLAVWDCELALERLNAVRTPLCITMKMSPLLMIAAALSISTLNTSCIKADAAAYAEHETAPENGAKFKKGEGVSLTDEMKQAIGLQIADVGEEKVAATLTLNLDATKTTEASGWISPQQASLVKPGASVELQTEGQSAVIKGIVRGMVPMLLGTLGDCQMTVITDQPLVVGTRMKGTLRASAGDAVAADREWLQAGRRCPRGSCCLRAMRCHWHQ